LKMAVFTTLILNIMRPKSQIGLKFWGNNGQLSVTVKQQRRRQD